MFEVVKSKHGIYCRLKTSVYCPICGYPMIPHSFTCGKHGNTCFVNIHYKCVNELCELYLTFGHVVEDAKLWEDLRKSKLHGKWYPKEIYIEEAKRLKVEDEVKKRLEKWGYF